MSGDLLAALIVGDIYAAEPFHLFGDHYGRNLQALIGGQTLAGRDRDSDHTVYFSLAQLGENVFLLVQTAVCVADDNTVAFIKGLVFDGFYDFTEKRVGYFRHQQADDIRPVAGQTLGDEIRLIIQFFDPVEHLLTCLCLDGRMIGEHSGDCDSRDACLVGDILHTDHGNPSFPAESWVILS